MKIGTYEHQMKSSNSNKLTENDDCLSDKEVPHPGLWKKLPHALSGLVFAHLPINEIFYLRCLNKTWNHLIAATSSIFSQDYDEAHPRMLSFITQILEVDPIWVRTLDMKRNKWYTYNIPIYDLMILNTGGAELVGYKVQDDCIFLLNLITRAWHQLPPVPSSGTFLSAEKFGNNVVVSIVEDNHSLANHSGIKLFSYDLLNGNRKWTILQPSVRSLLLKETWSSYDFYYDLNNNEDHRSSLFKTLKSETPSKLINWDYHELSLYVLWKKYEDSSDIHQQ